LPSTVRVFTSLQGLLHSVISAFAVRLLRITYQCGKESINAASFISKEGGSRRRRGLSCSRGTCLCPKQSEDQLEDDFYLQQVASAALFDRRNVLQDG